MNQNFFHAWRTFLALPLIVAVAGTGLLYASLTAQAAVTPTVTAVIQNGSNTNITNALVGTIVHANVVVASSTATTSPQGSVDFNLFPNTSCSGSPSVQSNVALNSNGAANSASTTLTNTGLSYTVHYDGQTDQYTTADSNCVSLSANQQAPTITAGLSATNVTQGASVSGNSNLSNVFGTAGGSATYTVYTNNSCTANPLSAGTVTVANSVVPNSSSIQFNTPGTYYWQVVYSGDANNSAATSTCGSAVLTVNASSTSATPTISTSLSNSSVTQGASVFDNASLSGALGNAGGSVTYRVYSDNACSANMQSAGTKTVTNASVPSSDSIQFNTPGTYYWQASYSGDVNNAAATSSCGSEILTVNATSSPQNGSGTISGNVFNDLNKNDVKDGSDSGLSGWTVWLHKADTSAWGQWNKWWNHGRNGYDDPIVATVTTDANGNYSFGNLGNGKYFVEESVMKGWNQTSDDTSVVISDAHTSQTVNFANVQKNNNGNGNGNGHNGNGNGNKGDNDGDQDDNGSSNQGNGHVGFNWNVNLGNFWKNFSFNFR